MILLPNGLDQNLQRLHLPLGQQPKLGTKEHKVLKTRIQVRCHGQRLQRPEETAVYNPVHPKQSAEYLPAQRREGGRLKHPQGLCLVVVVRELGLVVDLILNPLQYLFDVDGGADGHGGGVLAGALGPSVFDSGGEALAGSEGVEVGVFGHDGPEGGDVVVEVDGVDGYPSRAGFAGGEGHLFGFSYCQRLINNIMERT